MTNTADPDTRTYVSQFGENIRKFLQLQSTAGILLFGAMILAMVVKNSPLGEIYQALLTIPGQVRIGALNIEKPLFLWVNDGLMAIFFFLVGLEIKREVVEGYLSEKSQIILPLLAALGGMLVPALIYAALNRNDPLALRGWAVPTATDIAFALGVLGVLGSRIPVALKAFLLTIATLDDLGAIVVIAVFYTANLSLVTLAFAGVAVAMLAVLRALNVMRVGPYIVTGIILWVCVLKSGVHATLAGVLTAMAIPATARSPDETPPLRALIHTLHPWVAFGILPIFAFVNTGILFAGMSLQMLVGPVPMGIITGLFVGKQLGVFGFSWLAIKLRLAQKPPGISWLQIYGVSILCGIGFTMSLFIGGLAFSEGGAGYARIDRFGILVGSLLSGILGYLVLRVASKRSSSEAA